MAAIDLQDDAFEDETPFSRQVMFKLLAKWIHSEEDWEIADSRALHLGLDIRYLKYQNRDKMERHFVFAFRGRKC